MNDKDRKFIVKNSIEMYENLNEVVKLAGGCGFALEELEKMSAFDLIERLCTNNVRFCYGKQKKLFVNNPNAEKLNQEMVEMLIKVLEDSHCGVVPKSHLNRITDLLGYKS